MSLQNKNGTNWSQIETSLPNLKHRYFNPTVFTEQGVAILLSMLRSEKAIEVNVQIILAFVILRQYALGCVELNHKLEKFMVEINMQFHDIYQALTELASKKKWKISRGVRLHIS